jgi:hypothetical protein
MREFVDRTWKTSGPLASIPVRDGETARKPRAPRPQRPRSAAEETRNDGLLGEPSGAALLTPEGPHPLAAVRATPEAGRRRTRARKARRNYRSFVVRYGGEFTGIYNAEMEITPRAAFRRVEQGLLAENPGFDPNLLELYRPVLLRSARPARPVRPVRGKLEKLEKVEESPVPESPVPGS